MDRTLAFALALSLVSGAAVRAQAADDSSAHAAASPLAAEHDPDRVTVRTGRALDLEGRPIYSARSTFSETASVTLFSIRPIPAGPRNHSGQAGAVAPLASATLTSRFGMRGDPWLGTRRFHAGVDLAAPYGAPIRATNGGVVVTAGWRGGYGLLVTLGHGEGRQSRYGHLSRLAVSAGQVVKQGDVIGYVGSTGRSTGPHLHYEQRINGEAVRPRGVGIK